MVFLIKKDRHRNGYQHEWYLKNRDHVLSKSREYQKKRYQSHKEVEKKRKRDYYWNNRARRLEYAQKRDKKRATEACRHGCRLVKKKDFDMIIGHRSTREEYNWVVKGAMPGKEVSMTDLGLKIKSRRADWREKK